MINILDVNAAGDSKDFDRGVADAVRAMRRSLGVTVVQLAEASGLSRTSLEAIELGGSTTRAERYDISVAVGWLSNNCLARRLTSRSSSALGSKPPD